MRYDANVITDASCDLRNASDALVVRLCEFIDRMEFLEAERTRIAAILARFAAAPISISSIQPLLELNNELNGVKK